MRRVLQQRMKEGGQFRLARPTAEQIGEAALAALQRDSGTRDRCLAEIERLAVPPMRPRNRVMPISTGRSR